MNRLDKSFNRRRNKYRWERSAKINGVWSEMFDMKSTVNEIASRNFETGNFKFRMKPYKPYFLFEIWWFFKRLTIRIVIMPIKQLIQKIGSELIVGVTIIIVAYVIMKFIFKWSV